MLCRIIIILHVVDSSQVASRGYVHLFIYLSFVVFVFWRTNWIGRLVGSVSIHEMNESPFQAETVPAAQSVAR